MGSRARAYTVGAVALLAALGYVIGFLGPAVLHQGLLGWLFLPTIVSTLLWLMSIAVLLAASRVLLTGTPEVWVTVALAFIATAGLLELSSAARLASRALPGGDATPFGWAMFGLVAGVVMLVAGVMAAVALRREPEAAPRLRAIASGTRLVAILAVASIGLAVIALPQWSDETGRGFGSVLQTLGMPGGVPAGLGLQAAGATLESVLAVAAVALVVRRDLWLGVVGAVALELWGTVTAVFLSPLFPVDQRPAAGVWVIVGAFLALVTLLVVELRRGGPRAPAGSRQTPPGPSNPAAPASAHP